MLAPKGLECLWVIERFAARLRTLWGFCRRTAKKWDFKFKDWLGSGEIESAHRYVIQKRLKLPGAWWLEEHAETMLALRTHRANHDWANYWKKMAA